MWEYLLGLFALLRALTGIRFFLIKRKVNEPIEITSSARPFLKRFKGKKVVLFLHGFTSSPREFKEISEFFARHYISSYAPLLPGHGTSPERLAVIKSYQWIESVNESIDFLSTDYEEIYIVGSSFGGNLALLSSNHSHKIKGLVTIAQPIFFRKHRINKFLFLPLLKRIKIFQKKPKRVREFIDTHNGSYKVIPLKSAYEMSKIVEKSKKYLNQVIKPILVVSVENDSVVSEKSLLYLLDNVGSKKKKYFVLRESNHVALLGKYANKLNAEILKFIK